MALETYRAKRNFAVTAEPAGQAHKATAQSELSFVVQKHQASRLHYDFRLEWNGVLLSWAVPKGPSLDPTVKRLAVAVEDHPVDYGKFEGVIPEGEYGGGTVMVWDYGTWTPDVDVDEGLKNGELKFTLKAKKLKGSWVLVRTKGNFGGGDGRSSWLLIKPGCSSSTKTAMPATSTSSQRNLAPRCPGASSPASPPPTAATRRKLPKATHLLSNWHDEVSRDEWRSPCTVPTSDTKTTGVATSGGPPLAPGARRSKLKEIADQKNLR